jgi:hypothetical protein
MHETSSVHQHTYSAGHEKPPQLKMATSVDAKLLRATKFPPEFNQKVDMQKVNVEVMKK